MQYFTDFFFSRFSICGKKINTLIHALHLHFALKTYYLAKTLIC